MIITEIDNALENAMSLFSISEIVLLVDEDGSSIYLTDEINKINFKKAILKPFLRRKFISFTFDQQYAVAMRLCSEYDAGYFYMTQEERMDFVWLSSSLPQKYLADYRPEEIISLFRKQYDNSSPKIHEENSVGQFSGNFTSRKPLFIEQFIEYHPNMVFHLDLLNKIKFFN